MNIKLLANRFNYLLLTLFLLLTACTTITTKTSPQFATTQIISANQLQQQNQNRLISNWTVRGRIAVQMAQNGGSASVYWKQQGNNYLIELFGPLGAGAVYLNGTPGQIVLTSSKGQHLQAATPEILLHQALGWNLPVTNLNYWIRGIPAPGLALSRSFNDQGQLSQLQQDGWQIIYFNYLTEGNRALPQYMTLTRQGLIVKIIIDSWQLS